MKKLLLLSIIVLSFTFSKAQTTVITDDSTYTPLSTNAVMEIHSANGNKGILIPRLTTAQRTAISASAVNDISLLVTIPIQKLFGIMTVQLGLKFLQAEQLPTINN